MAARNVRAGGRRYRRSRFLRHDSRGVVSVVGTLLALLVFFSLFGIFLTQFVPLWMTDNEVQFTSQAQASIGTFKSNIDSQLSFGGPQVYATPFVMSSSGIPLLAQPTAGVLRFLPSTPGMFAAVRMDVGPGGGPAYQQNLSTMGTLSMTLPNRYFVPQVFQFEDDAVVQAQVSGNQVVYFPPILQVRAVPGNSSASLALVNLYGNSTTAVTSGTQDVYSRYLFAQTIVSNGKHVANGPNLPFNVTFKIGTQFPCAWQSYLNRTLAPSGMTFSLTPTAPTCSSVIASPSVVSLTLRNLNYFVLYFAGFQITLGVGAS